MTADARFLAVFLPFWMLATAVAQQPMPVLPQACVTYVPLQENSNIEMSRITTPLEVRDADKVGSPQGTTWFTQTRPDFMTPGPWNTTILIGHKRAVSMKLEAKNHASAGVQAEWLNEKLLFLRVWSGRLASNDLIFDVTTSRFIYSEEAHYGGIVQHCGS